MESVEIGSDLRKELLRIHEGRSGWSPGSQGIHQNGRAGSQSECGVAEDEISLESK